MVILAPLKSSSMQNILLSCTNSFSDLLRPEEFFVAVLDHVIRGIIAYGTLGFSCYHRLMEISGHRPRHPRPNLVADLYHDSCKSESTPREKKS